MPRSLPLLLALVIAGPALSRGGPNWTGLESALGRPGRPDGNALHFEFPRTDLNVMAQGVPLDPQGMLASSFLFKPEGKACRMEGEVLVLGLETSRVLAQAAKHGLRVSGLDSPFGDCSPHLQRVHVEGQGPARDLGWAARVLLGSTGTPMASPAPATPSKTPTQDPWAGVKKALGPGFEVGRTFHYEWAQDLAGGGSVGRWTVILQKEGKEMAAWVECPVPVTESAGFLDRFLKGPFQVTAWTRSWGGNGPGWADLWSLGEEKPLLADLRTLLEGSGFEERKAQTEGQP